MSKFKYKLQTQSSNALLMLSWKRLAKIRTTNVGTKGNYVHMEIIIKRYLDTKPNRELIPTLSQKPPYTYHWLRRTVQLLKVALKQLHRGIDEPKSTPQLKHVSDGM
ncbi:hypothetical protein Tco_0701446 [Tanacetum coccineum]